MGEDAFARDGSGSEAMVVGDARTITRVVRLRLQLVVRNHTMPVADRAGEQGVHAEAWRPIPRWQFIRHLGRLLQVERPVRLETTEGNISRNLQPCDNNTIIAGRYGERVFDKIVAIETCASTLPLVNTSSWTNNNPSLSEKPLG